MTITSDINITNGQPTQRTATGTYTVNPDCTGTVALQFSDSPNPTVMTFVILDGGNERRFVSTTPGVSILGLVKRQWRLTRREADPPRAPRRRASDSSVSS